MAPAGRRWHSLPMPSRPVAAQALDPPVALPSMPQLRTFLVEDSPVIRDNLSATLEELAPVQVVGAAPDEDSALRWLASHAGQVDLVIVDLFLQAGSGLNLLRASQDGRNSGQPAQAGCHFAVLSNYVTPDIRRRCLALGADRVFDKSTDIDALIQYCQQLASPPPA